MSQAPASVSLLIPCYNAEKFLPALFESIKKLDQPFDEILLYDDGSTDRTVAVARKAGMEIITGEANRGVAYARNRLMECATGEWLHFQDADDPISADFLTVMRPLLRPDIDVAVCDSDWLDDASQTRLIAWRYPPADLRSDPLLANLRNGVSSNAMIIRRSRLIQIGGFDESMRMWEDADLHIRLAAAGARYDGLGKVASISIRRNTSLSHDYRTSWGCRLSALERYASTLPERVLSEIAAQADKAARELLHFEDRPAARRALALNHRLGGCAPVSRHFLIQAVRGLLGSWTALRLQVFLRRCSK